MIEPYFALQDFELFHGDSSALLQHIDTKVDMIFADPPYFLSTGNGVVNINGHFVKFDKGQWDRVRTDKEKDDFNLQWLSVCSKVLKENGTIWVSGTYHNIFSVKKCLDELGFEIINIIIWQKPDPPVTLSCRRFNFSAEYIIWACRKTCKNYLFNYDALVRLNGGKQMQDVWKIAPAGSWEKTCGKHPTQKPLRLLYRIILASTPKDGIILDPFSGSATTGIAANLMGRKFIGCEIDMNYLQLGVRRRLLLEDKSVFVEMKRRIEDLPTETMILVNHARMELKQQMIKTGICYVRIGESKGSVLVTYGFERMQYVLLHTNGTDAHLFRLKTKGSFQIWTKENLMKYGFNPQSSPYYAVFLFDNTFEYPIPQTYNLRQKIMSYRANIRPLEDFYVD